MKTAQEEIKNSLHNSIGEVTFEHGLMKILSNNIGLSEKYISEMKKELASYQDMASLEINVNHTSLRNDKSREYRISFSPADIVPTAMHHLRHITHSFRKKYCHHQPH